MVEIQESGSRSSGSSDPRKIVFIASIAGPAALVGIFMAQSDRDTAQADLSRLASPAEVTARAGEPFEVRGWVREEGITDRSPGVDPDPDLIGEVGYGPSGSDPAQDPMWVWSDARPNDAWNGEAAGRPDDDEYIGQVAIPQSGEWNVAVRFSVDAGRHWQFGDLDDAEGYDPARAGRATIVE